MEKVVSERGKKQLLKQHLLYWDAPTHPFWNIVKKKQSFERLEMLHSSGDAKE